MVASKSKSFRTPCGDKCSKWHVTKLLKLLQETRRAREIAKQEGELDEDDNKKQEEEVENGHMGLAAGGEENGENSDSDPKKHCWKCKISDQDAELRICARCHKVIQKIKEFLFQAFAIP